MLTGTPHKILKETFGFDSFRGDQEAVIAQALSGKSVLCLMPTGMGKSLCFQIPTLVQGGLTVVVSPLIALMSDQASKAHKKGFKVCDIHSQISKEEREKRYRKLKNREYDLIYVAPERFRKQEFLDALKSNEVKLLAIDEAHCISQWGHDFRPDYTRLKDIRSQMGNPPVLMLTATATPEVQKDILKQLGLNENQTPIFHSGIKRENLALNVHDLYGTENKTKKLLELLENTPGSKIVYFSLISTLEKVSEVLEKKFPYLRYHGQLPRGPRAKMQKMFLNEEGHTVFATPAFGLGIDKQNIRSVIHFEIPANLESYYQEVGRAGRDGLPSQCHLLYDEDDVSIQMEFIKWAHPDAEFMNRVYQFLSKNLAKANQVGLDGIREDLHFKSKKDFRLETTLNLFERWDITEGSIEDKNLKIISEISTEMQDSQKIAERLKSDQMGLLKMVQWISTNECRALEVYKHFGFEFLEKCGLCDNCLNEDAP